MNELSCVVYKVDFKYLIENCLRRELWNKSWTVYNYDNLKIDLALYQIAVEENELHLSIKGTHSYFSVPMSKDHFNEVVFSKSLKRQIEQVIEVKENIAINALDVMKNAASYDDQLKNSLTERAEAFLDENGVTNSEIREVYIDYFVDSKFESFANRIRTSMKHRVHPQRYLMLYNQFGDKDSYEYVVNKNNENDNADRIKEIEEELAQLNIEYETMIDDLCEDMPKI